MNEVASKRLHNTALRFRTGHTGARVDLRWRTSHAGGHDAYRDEYIASGEDRVELPNVPCLLYEVTGNQYDQGSWGNAEVGDLILALDKKFDTDSMEDLRVILQDVEYKVVPNSVIPSTRLSGIIAGTSLSRVIHCRFVGEEQEN